MPEILATLESRPIECISFNTPFASHRRPLHARRGVTAISVGAPGIVRRIRLVRGTATCNHCSRVMSRCQSDADAVAWLAEHPRLEATSMATSNCAPRRYCRLNRAASSTQVLTLSKEQLLESRRHRHRHLITESSRSPLL